VGTALVVALDRVLGDQLVATEVLHALLLDKAVLVLLPQRVPSLLLLPLR